MILDFELLYNIYTQDFISLVQGEDFYTEFMNKARSGNSEVSYMHRFIDKQIDLTWVEAIEEAIIPLDNIIRNPRRFIVQEEEIVNIELARKISPESIRHLAQHTNMIAKVEEDTVTPNRILNIFKEESFETYENRFIYTLLINLQYFISKRLRAINDSVDGNNVTSILFKDNFKIGKENVKCTFEMTIDSPGFKMDSNLLDVDPEKLSKFQRIERIKKILYDFQNSPLIKTLHGTSLVRPPIMRTNVLQKNPDFKKAKALWDFIETYRDSGFNVEVTETNEIPSENYLADLYSTMVLNYSLLKHYIGNEGDYEPQKKRKIITPQLIERTFFDVLDDLTFDIDVVKKIFNEQVEKTSKKRQKREKEVLAVIDQAIKTEKKRKEDIERARLAELERQKAEKRAEQQRIRDEKKKKLEEEKQAKLLIKQEQQRLREEAKKKLEAEKLARQLEREEKKRLKEEEQKRLEEEKRRKAQEKQELQKALEKQKELERKQKEREKLKLQKEKQLQAEKERQRKIKEQQKLREQKAKELAQQKEDERKRKEREKLRLQKEKQALEEKERQRKIKEQQKLREQKARELAQQKEDERKRREREKLRLQKEKQALEEKERQRREREQQKLKEKQAKELAQQKEAEQKRKEREKLRLQKEKQALLEKERLRKAKEREKLKEKKAKEAALLKEKEAKIKAREKAKLEALREKSKKNN
ncbi:MAG: hypothetical protein E7434_02825 [Ruminococcaceae bacterium]|nr:hypothetical protein [Oscillospiraceae bacterium]